MSIEEKLEVIERLVKGESIKLISNILGVGVNTVKDLRRNKTSIQDYCTQIECVVISLYIEETNQRNG